MKQKGKRKSNGKSDASTETIFPMQIAVDDSHTRNLPMRRRDLLKTAIVPTCPESPDPCSRRDRG